MDFKKLIADAQRVRATTPPSPSEEELQKKRERMIRDFMGEVVYESFRSVYSDLQKAGEGPRLTHTPGDKPRVRLEVRNHYLEFWVDSVVGSVVYELSKIDSPLRGLQFEFLSDYSSSTIDAIIAKFIAVAVGS